MTLPEKYAHDYRDMAMSEEELRKMLEEFADEIRKERVTHCDDINCPECPKAAYEAGVKAERERASEKVKKLGLSRRMKVAETQFALKQLRKQQPELTMHDIAIHNAEAEGYNDGYEKAMSRTIDALTDNK